MYCTSVSSMFYYTTWRNEIYGKQCSLSLPFMESNLLSFTCILRKGEEGGGGGRGVSRCISSPQFLNCCSGTTVALCLKPHIVMIMAS